MSRKLIIDGNAVYEIDEDCMLRKRLDRTWPAEHGNNGDKQKKKRENRNTDNR